MSAPVYGCPGCETSAGSMGCPFHGQLTHGIVREVALFARGAVERIAELERELAAVRQERDELAATQEQLRWHLRKAAGVCMIQGNALDVCDDEGHRICNQWELGERCHKLLEETPRTILSAHDTAVKHEASQATMDWALKAVEAAILYPEDLERDDEALLSRQSMQAWKDLRGVLKRVLPVHDAALRTKGGPDAQKD